MIFLGATATTHNEPLEIADSEYCDIVVAVVERELPLVPPPIWEIVAL